MDEDSNGEKSNNSAKRSKLDNVPIDENETSMSNANDIQMSQDVPNAEEENKATTSTSVEDSGYAENVKTNDLPEPADDTGPPVSSVSSDYNEAGEGTSLTRRTNNRMNSRTGARRRNYRMQIVSSSSSEDFDDIIDNIVPSSLERRSERSETPSNLSSDNELSLDNDSDSSTYSFECPNFYSGSSDSNSSSKESEGNSSHESILIKPKPNYNWSLIHEIMFREHGLPGTGRKSVIGNGALAFQDRLYGARHTIEKMSLFHKLKRHDGCVNSLNFNKAGNLLVSGSDDLKIILWNWASNKIAYKFSSGHNSNVFQTKFIELAGGFNIVSSGRDGQVRHAMIPPSGSSKIISTVLFKHTGSVHKIALSPYNPYEILTAGEDGHVVRCDLRENRIERVVTVKIKKRKVPLYSIAHHPLDQEFCVCGRDQFIRVYDKRNTRKTLHMMCPQHLEDKKAFVSHITCAVYNSTGTEILASYSDEDIYLFNNKCYLPGHFTHRYRGHNNNKTIKGVNFFGQNSEYIVSGSDCGNFFFWDKNTESIINWIKGDSTGVVNCLEPHPSFPILATSGLDHDVKIWVPSNINFPPKMEGLEKCVKHNIKRSALPENDLFDDRTFFFFVRQCLRNRRSAPTEDNNCPIVQDLISSSSGEEDGLGPDDNVHIGSLPCTPQ